MAFTLPAQVSVVGDAKLIRHLYLPTPGTSYIIYTAPLTGSGDRLYFRELLTPDDLDEGTTPEFGNEQRVDPQMFDIRNFYALETNTTNEVLVLYDDGLNIYRLTYNPVSQTLIEAPNKAFKGTLPALINDGLIRAFFLRDEQVKLRNNAQPPELTLVDLTSLDTRDIDVARKGVTSFVRYIGQHQPATNISLDMRDDGSVEILYNNALTIQNQNFSTLPTGTVSYYSMDDADFSGSTLLDQGPGANNGTPSGDPSSATGVTNEARNFDGNDYYSLGNPVDLQISGDQFIAYWFRPANFAARNENSWAKSFSSEGTINHNAAGSLSYLYGNNTTPNSGGFRAPTGFDVHSVGSASLGQVDGEWTWVAHVRDFTNNRLRWYVNGVLASQQVPFYSTAAASSGTAFINNGYLGTPFTGDTDEFLIGNAAPSSGEVLALYHRGLLGLRADAAVSVPVSIVEDQSVNGNDGEPVEILSIPRGLLFSNDDSRIYMAAITVPAAITIEAWIYPTFNIRTSYVLDSGGALSFAYTNNGLLEFSFDNGGTPVVLSQVDGSRLEPRKRQHIAVSHTFGSGGSTFMSLNGKVVQTAWSQGTGSETPVLDIQSLTIALGKQDVLEGFRVSNIARTLSDINDYVRGRI